MKTKDKVQERLGELFDLLQATDEARVPEHLRNIIRFLVARVEELEVRMDGDKNHARPHIHIKYKKNGLAASYAIDDGSRLAGRLPPYYDRVVCHWINKNRAELNLLWKSTQSGKRNEVILLKFQGTIYS
jgi:Domain of unknown function (DUF4160)